MLSHSRSFTRLCQNIIMRLAVVVSAIYYAAPAAAQPPGSLREQQTHMALLIAAISGGGFILVVGLMRWYGQRQARARREQQSDQETPWDRVQRHLAETDSEEDSTDDPH